MMRAGLIASRDVVGEGLVGTVGRHEFSPRIAARRILGIVVWAAARRRRPVRGAFTGRGGGRKRSRAEPNRRPRSRYHRPVHEAQAAPFAALHTAQSDVEIIELIRAPARLASGSAVLDVACGPGSVAVVLAGRPAALRA